MGGEHRRRLGEELRLLREAAGYTVEEICERLLCPPAQVRAFEDGGGGLGPGELDALLGLYDVSDTGIRDRLMELTDGADDGAAEWDDGIPESVDHSPQAELEAQAREIRDYQPLFVPGLLQTEEYARALLEGRFTNTTAEEVELRLALQRQRVRILDAPQPPRIWAVIGEAALRQEVGGAGVMAAQHAHLLELAACPAVTLQVLPFSAGAHPGIHGGFGVLSFTGEQSVEVVRTDMLTSQLYTESQREVGEYVLAFMHLRAAALGIPETVAFLEALSRARTRRSEA